MASNNILIASRTPVLLLFKVLVVLLLIGTPIEVFGSGARFVTGSSFSATQPGQPIAFRIANPLYYTDPGILSASVTHNQAEAMVAAAAAVWNVPTANLTLARGGSLNEHVSAANITFGRGGLAFPADVAPSNYLAKPIAVIFDTDGSVTDLLLGSGASDPAGCRESGVTADVDGFGAGGTINHATLIVNGRCATGTGQPLMQLQYQVERAFGRILGLSWSQLNDNIFTGATQPTAAQMTYWPVMHPIDVICGPYTYLCMTSAFTLRSDDLNALEQLYPVRPENVLAGKVASLSDAITVQASLNFPTSQGMDMVNVAVRRQPIGRSEIEPYQVTSGVTGTQFQQRFATSISGPVPSGNDVGTSYRPAEALVTLPYVDAEGGATLFMTTEAINPLYTGAYAIGPYARPPVTPSGSAQTFINYSARPGTEQAFTVNVDDAAATCVSGADGSEIEPVPATADGWWTGQLCSVGHTSWWSAAIKPGRSWTLEVTALDESGATTLNKAQPVMGIWRGADPAGIAPTLASTQASMNAIAPGVTQIRMPVTASGDNFRIAVADQFGGGRPDFTYRARLLYAQSISPTVVGAGGGQVTIAGQGFQPGMKLTVNGAAATVLRITPTTILAQVPTMAVARASSGVMLPVVVTDPATAGWTTMINAVRYTSAAANLLRGVSAPVALETAMEATTPFAVRVVTSDGSTPVTGAAVQLNIMEGFAVLSACGTTSTCTVASDGNGLVQTAVTGTASGAITLSATLVVGGGVITATMTDADPVRSFLIADPTRFLAGGASGGWGGTRSATQDGAAAMGVPVTWRSTAGGTVGAVNAATSGTGTASVMLNVLSVAPGATVTFTGCAWVTVCTSWQVVGVSPAQWLLAIVNGAGQSVGVDAALSAVQYAVTDGLGHAVQGATVQLYQTVDAWEGMCGPESRCAAAPVLAASKATLTSDADGLLSAAPLRVQGVPQVVNLAAVAGPAGFITISLTVTP